MLNENAMQIAKEIVICMIGQSEKDATCDSVEEILEHLYNKIQDLTKEKQMEG